MDLNRVQSVDDVVPVRNALISVADKSGIEQFVADLWALFPSLNVYSSGGTYRKLERIALDANRTTELHDISSYTGQPEMQGGLVKTLDFRIYLGLLSETYNPAHRSDLERTGAIPFDLTVCNFYPFEETAAHEGVTIEDLRTHIDIGGPTMLRASAKNFLRLAAICSPDEYPKAIDVMSKHKGTTLAYRADLAARAFRYTSHYENAIAGMIGSYVQHDRSLSVYTIADTERDTERES